MVRICKFSFLFFALSFSLFAQEGPIDDDLQKDWSVWEVEGRNFISPVTTPAVWIFAAGAALTYAMYQDKSDNNKIGFNPDYDKRSKPWREVGNVIGWGLLQLGYTATQIPGIRRGDKEALNNTEIMWKSTLYTSLSTFILKMTVSEQRQDSEEKFESFPSGHASAAFAFATNVAIRHAWYWNFVSVPLTVLAATSRVDDDSHYWHDAVFGATLGMSFAYGMNYLADRGRVPFLLGFEPVEKGGGITMSYKF